MYSNNNTFNVQGQVLVDEYISAKSGEVRKRDWRGKKMRNEQLALIYDVVNARKAERLRECASCLTFSVSAAGDRRLIGMNSCRVRLCPICTWRRSLRNYYNNKRIAEYLEENSSGRWLLLTLTVKNVTGEDLSTTIDELMYAWNKLTKNVNVKRVVLGYYRGLEVTHNIADDTYHPHFHCLLHVRKDYMCGANYISQKKWTDYWQQALQCDYIPIVDIRNVKDFGTGISGSIAEISKYACKDTDYIYSEAAVRVLDHALDGRRLIAYGGDIRRTYTLLRLTDADSGDLVNVSDEAIPDSEEIRREVYFWHTGYRQYYRGQ